jgi:hypothetical protein
VPGRGAVLSVSQAYVLLPVLPLIIAVGVAYWLEVRGVITCRLFRHVAKREFTFNPLANAINGSIR